MRNDQLAWGGVLAIGLLAGLILPKLTAKARLDVRRATGIIHRSGFSNPSVRAQADPARGIAA